MLIAIAAMTSDRVIGNNNTLPRHLPADLRKFKELTLGHSVVMGRKTYESLPEAFRPLPGRHNIVLSSSQGSSPLIKRHPEESSLGAGRGDVFKKEKKTNTSLEIISDIQNIIDKKNSPDDIYVIGGSQIYHLLLPYCDRLHITQIKGSYEGDAYFPSLEDSFSEISRESYDTHDFVVYERKL